jgi:hypothetical protein
MLRSESLCRAIPSRCQDHTGNPNRGSYLLDISRNIELIFIRSVPESRLHRRLPWDRGKHLLELHWRGSSHHHGGPGWSTFVEQLQQVSYHREIRSVRCPDAQWLNNSESKSGLQRRVAPDHYGVNSAHGTWRLSPCHFGTAKGWGS